MISFFFWVGGGGGGGGGGGVLGGQDKVLEGGTKGRVMGRKRGQLKL